MIEKANLLATDNAAHRERIEALTDRYAIRVKTGDRRAALWKAEDGTWWLLSAELDELLTNGDAWQPVNPSTDGSEHFSHLARGSIVTLAYLTGIEITALCGASIVAHRDYERFPVCPTCQESLELLRSLRKPEGA